MIIQNETQYQAYKTASALSTQILRELVKMVKPGVLPSAIDQKAFELCKKHGVKPSFFGVKGYDDTYKYATCISINEVAVHGIPDSKRQIQPGDLVKVDFGITSNGYVTDQCVTVGISPLKSKDQQLLEIGRQAVLAGVEQAVVGNMTGDIGHAIERVAREHKFDTIKHYIGHGIGHHLHEEPEVPATGLPHTGTDLVEGQVICVEAQVVAGKPDITLANDGWSVSTRDGKNAVMFEFMVVVRKDKAEILTETQDWSLTT